MKNPVSILLEKLSALSQRLFGSQKPAQPVPCQFCGATDHRSEDCPNAAKYKLFHIDRE
jgi:hypothetical protein